MNSHFLSIPLNSSNSERASITLNSALINEFYLTQLQVASLDSYYVRHWTGEYLKHTLSIHGTLFYQDVEYIVILPSCIRDLFFKSPQVKLSFRKTKPGLGIPSYVLVRFVK